MGTVGWSGRAQVWIAHWFLIMLSGLRTVALPCVGCGKCFCVSNGKTGANDGGPKRITTMGCPGYEACVACAPLVRSLGPRIHDGSETCTLCLPHATVEAIVALLLQARHKGHPDTGLEAVAQTVRDFHSCYLQGTAADLKAQLVALEMLHRSRVVLHSEKTVAYQTQMGVMDVDRHAWVLKDDATAQTHVFVHEWGPLAGDYVFMGVAADCATSSSHLNELADLLWRSGVDNVPPLNMNPSAFGASAREVAIRL